MPQSGSNPLDPATLDGQRESVWRQLLAIDEELQSFDRDESRAAKTIDSVVQTVLGRVKRKRKQFTRACVDAIRKVLLANLPTDEPSAGEFRVTKEDLDTYGKYVAQCAEQWTKEIVIGFDNDIRATLLPLLGSIPEAPAELKPSTNRATIHGEPLAKPVHVPTESELILKHWNANKDLAIVPIGLLGLGYFAFITPWNEPVSKILASAGPVISVPLGYLLGKAAARKERRKIIREARDVFEASVVTFAKEGVEEAFQEHEESLGRWIQSRADAWKKALATHRNALFSDIHKKSIADRRRELLLEKKRLELRERELTKLKE